MRATEYLKEQGITADTWQYHGSERYIGSLMEQYAKLYHESEVLKLNKAHVSSSVCDHDFTEACFNRSNEFMYYLCSKCGEQQTDC